jgi:hypothetical protein
MKASLFTELGLAIALLASSCGAWAQEPDASTPPPPPPPGRFAFVRGGPMFEGPKPVTGAPFTASATTQITQVLADGNQIDNKETATVARDSAGRIRRDSVISRIGLLASEGKPPEIVRIVDPVAGTSYMLDVAAKTAVQMPFHARQEATKGNPRGEPSIQVSDDVAVVAAGQKKFRREPANSQRTTESLGSRVMEDVNVEGTRTTETIPAGAIGNRKPIVIVNERWYSPDLQETIYSKRTDPRFGTTIYQLTNITRQEPDESLFRVPADYTLKEGPVVRLRTRID